MEKYYGIISIIKTPKNFGDKLAEALYKELTDSSLIDEGLLKQYSSKRVDSSVFHIYFESESVPPVGDLILSKEIEGYVRDKETLGQLYFNACDSAYRGIHTDELHVVVFDTSLKEFSTYSSEMFEDSELADMPNLITNHAFDYASFKWLTAEVLDNNSYIEAMKKIKSLETEHSESCKLIHSDCKSISRCILLDEIKDTDKVLAIKSVYNLIEC